MLQRTLEQLSRIRLDRLTPPNCRSARARIGLLFSSGPRPVRSIMIILLIVMIADGVSAAELVKNNRISIIHLNNGSDYVTGTLVHTNAADCLGWKSPAFTSPFQFSMTGVSSIHFSAPDVLPQPEGAYSFELAGGDLLYGALVGLTAETAIVDVPEVGRLTVDRDIIQRIFRRGGGNDVLFVGPSGLNGWQTPGEAGVWHEDAGHIFTDKQGAVLRRDFGMPNQVRIEFELSWTGQPDFELAIGVDDVAKTVSRAYRFDVWENELVIQRETEREANVELLQKLQGKSGRIHVQAFLDQTRGHLLVYSSAGEPLADMTVTTGKSSTTAPVYGGIQLTNRRGDIRLERLQISRWSGDPPRSVEVDKSRIHVSDGTIIYGTLKSFDPEKRQFVVGDNDNSETISEDRIQDVFLSKAADVVPRAMRAVYLTGMKISGDLIDVENQNVRLKSPGIHEPIETPFSAMQSLVVLMPQSEQPELPQRKGRLEVAGLLLNGCLVDGKASDETSCFVWQPIASRTASAMQKNLAARIVYKELPKPAPPTAQQQNRAAGNGIPQRIVSKVSTPKSSTSKAKSSHSIVHLRTGDTIECEVVSVDEQGLTFKSENSTATFVPHEHIHAVELDPNAAIKQIDAKKQERLLTLPRMQRGNPPTQLIRDLDGDYLRGRLVAINDAQIQVELRLEGKLIPRDRIARIIWLHPEAMTKPANDAEASSGMKTDNLVQSLTASDDSRNKANRQIKRMTFIPEQVEGSILSGRNELFGPLRVDLMNVDELLVGAAIEKVTAELPFGRWKLKQSLDPVGPKESADESGEGGEGQESPLIGKDAPEIALKTLDGTKFSIKAHHEKVVVLDFWASWCGPCMQVMPQIDKVIEEFADQGVELFAVNLEETPEKIKAALERLKLSPTVLLDRDGRVAERYGASSIPQTVIINRDGKVVRVFVGGGPRFDEQLRTALKSVLSGGEQKEE